MIVVKKLFFENRILLFSTLIVFFSGAFTILFTTKEELHLFFNSFVDPLWNPFFIYTTHLGDGYFIGLVITIFLMTNARMCITILSTYAVSSIIVQGIKYFIFPDALRPNPHFEQLPSFTQLHLVSGIDTLRNHSFPSGHTTAAFSLFFTLALMSKNNYIKILFLITAILVGFTRIYLSQHFFEDAYTGMIIGIICSITFYLYYYHSKNSIRFEKLERSIIKIIKSK